MGELAASSVISCLALMLCRFVLLVGAVFDLLAVFRGLEGVTVMSGRGNLPPLVAVYHDEGPPQAKPVPCARVVSSSANPPEGEWRGGTGEEVGEEVYDRCSLQYLSCFSVCASAV